MIGFLKRHKLGMAIGVAVLALCALLILWLASYFAPENAQEVPAGRIHDAGVFEAYFGEIEVHDSTEGEITIESTLSGEALELLSASVSPKTTSDPETIWAGDPYAGNHTSVEKVQMANDSIGVLTIEKIDLSVNVYESPDNMEAMSKGVAHFPSTSAYDGNVGLSAHNINFDGSDGYFKLLHTLEKGDRITYQTALGERSYTVERSVSIDASDWTPLGYTDDHRLTLITCISGQPNKRLCVQAVAFAQ